VGIAQIRVGKTPFFTPFIFTLAQGILVQPSMQQNLVLSAADRAMLDARACRELWWTMCAQVAMALLAAALAAGFAGKSAGWSALAGASAYILPNGWMALRLFLSLRKAAPLGPAAFVAQELLKLFMTALMLWGLARMAGEWLIWPAVLLGLVFALKGYVLLLMFRKLS